MTQSALHTAGRFAAEIEGLWWIFFWVCTAIYVVVIAVFLVALLRKRRAEPVSGDERRALRVVAAATIVSAATLFFFLIATMVVGRNLMAYEQPQVTIVLTGRQWWWQAEYDHADKSKRFTTANELYIPVGEPVRVKLRTADVIHSFWVPSLQGKRDLTPGLNPQVIIQADRPGVYRGQCAEFCGVQHAKMALWVNAVSRQDFDRWAASQQQSSKIPSTAAQRKGQEAFMNAGCPLCHTIGGTNASGKVAPDLTHFGSRRSIAAGTVPNRRGYLAAWIIDPQHMKPGSNMPPNAMPGSDLNALLDYMESLQ
jgi:cytochrome c oxidase subunit II